MGRDVDRAPLTVPLALVSSSTMRAAAAAGIGIARGAVALAETVRPYSIGPRTCDGRVSSRVS